MPTEKSIISMRKKPKSSPSKKRKPYNLSARLRSALRDVWRKSPYRQQALTNARVSRGTYRCAGCSNLIGTKQIRVDHVEPVVSISGFVCWDTYINRLFCDVSNLQVLCLECHTKKTGEERSARSKAKKSCRPNP